MAPTGGARSSGSDPALVGSPTALAQATPQDGPARPVPFSGLAAMVERALDVTVIGLAIWTVVYHVCLVVDADVWVSLLLMLVSTAGWIAASRRRGRTQQGGELETAPQGPLGDVWPSMRRPLVLPTSLAATAAALAFATQLPWPVVVGTWLLAALLGVAAAWRALGRDGRVGPPERDDLTGTAGLSVLVALGWGLVLGAISVTMLRSNPDDVYYVNLSQWIAEHGSFPLRDTIYGDLVYPMTSWPPVASYDALVGSIAHVLHVRAATVAYDMVPPVAAVLAVLAMWSLLRQWRVPAISLALTATMVFLLFDGGAPYSPGNLLVGRLWQGKILFLALAVPILLTYASRYVVRPSRSTLTPLALVGVASVGLTTSAMFLTPLLAAASMAPLVRTRRHDAVLGFGALSAYPLGAAAVTTALHGHSADSFERKTYRFDPSWFGPEVFHHGPVAFLAVVVVLVAAVLLPGAAARLTTAVLAVMVGVSLVPGVTRVTFDLTGLGPTLWRLTWLTPTALLVGVLVARVVTAAPSNRQRLVAAGAVLATMALLLRPVWSDGDTSWHLPFHSQRPTDSVETADRLIKLLDPGDTVLASQSLSITVAVFTTQLTAVSPRDYFLDYLRDEPGFHANARVRLERFVEDDSPPWSARQVARDLDLLSVDAVCLDITDGSGAPRSAGWMSDRLALLRSQGFSSNVRSDNYVCVWR